MPRTKFDPKNELIPIGQYDRIISNDIEEAMGIPPMPPQPKFNRPVTPKENFKMALEGKTPYWIPFGGWMMNDMRLFRPRTYPDNVACRVLWDAEPCPEWPGKIIRSSWFDLDWEFSPIAGGSTVHPGNPKVPDISKWEDYVSMPTLDGIDFKRSGEINKAYLGTDLFNQLGLTTGLWERLMSLMDVDNAAIAMIDDDQKEGVHRLFDQYTDLLIEFIQKTAEYTNLDCVLIHDDMGHQQSSFFSLDTCREMLVPYYKRITDAVHKLDLYFELHCCGKAQGLVPAMIEAGIDLWCPQNMNDYEMLTRTYKDDPIMFGLREPDYPLDADRETIRKATRVFVDKFKDYRVAINYAAFADGTNFLSAAYEFSRTAYQDAED